MNLDKIKNLIEKDGGKFIIVEDGEPILTVMSFSDYEKIINGYKNNPFKQADSMVEQEKETKELEQEQEQEGLDKRQKPWQEPGIESKEQEGLSSESRNFLDMPIQDEDEEAELESLPVK
jgi:hypothetical protein